MSAKVEEILMAEQLGHREEIGKQAMQLALYRQALVDAGIEPPDRSGEELLQMWRDCAAVTSTVSEFIVRLGTAKELLFMKR